MAWSVKSFFLLAGLSLLALPPLPAADLPNLGVLAPKMQHFVDDHLIPGAVMLVGDKDKILDVETIGVADLATKKPMAPEDLFYIASMSKAMTCSALMMLVDEGKVNIDDPVSKYIPEFAHMVVVDPKDPTHTPHPAQRPITVRMVMSHSSGLPRGAPGEKLPLDTRAIKDVVLGAAKAPLVYQPDTDYLYSNVGIATAAYIVQLVSGMPYEDFMQKRLFDPLGMKDTTFWPTTEQQRRLPTEYIEMGQAPWLRSSPIRQLSYPLEKKEGRHPFPAGGLFSTAPDVAKFLQMFLNRGMVHGRRLLSEKSVHLATIKEAATKPYGFAWSISSDGAFSHGGALHTYMGVDPKAGIVRVFMTQLGAPYRPGLANIFKDFEDATMTLAPHPSAAPATHDRTEGAGG
jgi:CubicO group peptidase (beta-lactamase class C family)